MGALYAAVGGSLLVWIVLAWATAALAGLTGTDYYIAGGLLSIIGIIGAGVFAWWKMRQERSDLPADLVQAAPYEQNG